MTTTRYALLIGIINYPKILDPRRGGFANLRGCHNDVEKMRKVLLEARGFEAKNIWTLLDSEAALAAAAQEGNGGEQAMGAASKAPRLPTRKGILAAMEQLLNKVQEGDIVLLYYAGHGSRVRNPRWPGKVFETLVPHDSGRGEYENRDIFDVEIDLWIRRLDQKRVASTTLIFDSCHSGSVTRGGGLEEGKSHSREVPVDLRPPEVMFAEGSERAALLERPTTMRGVAAGLEMRQASGWLAGGRSAMVLAACGAEQKAKETSFMVRKEDGERFSFERGDVGHKSRHHGVLTMFLAEELRNPEHLRWSQVVAALQDKIQEEAPGQQTHLEGDGPVLVPGSLDSSFRAPALSLELRRHALVIGISAYSRNRGVQPLHTPEKDARAMAKVLAEGHRYDTVDLLLNGEATLEAILQRLRSLKRSLEPASALVLYFAGHGMAEGGVGLDFEGYLWPVDADGQNRLSWLRMDAVMRELAGFRCRHLLVVLDCCFAGAFTASSRGVARSRKMFRNQYERAVRGQSWRLLASSAHNQLARDQDPTAQGHSPFANALLAGLGSDRAQGTADFVDDGIVTTTELFLHIQQALRDVPEQEPVLSSLSPLNEGEFIFVTTDQLDFLQQAPELEESENPWVGEPVEGAGESEVVEGMRGLKALREVIVGPAEAHQLFFETNQMVDELLDEVAGSPAPRMLLSLTLAEVFRRAWKRQQETGVIDRELKRVDLRAVGGVGGVLAERAEAVFQRASRASKKTLRRLFLRLIAVDGEKPAARVVGREELEAWQRWPLNEQKSAVAVVQTLLAERIVVLHQHRLQLASGRIISSWERLQGWLKAPGEEDFLRDLHLLGQAAADWRRQAEDFRLLWSDRHPLVTKASKRLPDLNHPERRFVEACGRQRKISLRLWALVAVMAVVCGLAFFFYQGSEKARRTLMIQALAARAVEEAGMDWQRSLLFAVQAAETARKSGGEGLAVAEDALRQVLRHRLRALPLESFDVAALISQACDAAAGRNLTQEEWKQYVPGERYRSPCEKTTESNHHQPKGNS